MDEQTFALPQPLGDGLLLRWATPEDVEAVAAFNMRLHSLDGENPDSWLGDWTHSLMSGNHPTTKAADFTVVVDTKAANKIVSSLCLIPQTWGYEGIPFGCGRPELVGTDGAYRRRGLVRAQFTAVHAKSAARGELVQAITGIPWYYRQFGYEMTLGLSGGRSFYWNHSGNDQTVTQQAYRVRPVAGPTAVANDTPLLVELYNRHCASGPIYCLRDAAQWHYGLFVVHRSHSEARNVSLILNEQEQVVGYAEWQHGDEALVVRELAVLPGQSLRAVVLFLVRWLKQEADQRSLALKSPITHVQFEFGESDHPAYAALSNQLTRFSNSYWWYVRVADLPAFLGHIAPVLEKRLAASVLAGYTGNLRLNFYYSQLKLQFVQGKLGAIVPYLAQSHRDTDALFPEQTFLHLLFGHRSLAEVHHIWGDCYARREETAVLINALFPKRPSHVIPFG